MDEEPGRAMRENGQWRVIEFRSDGTSRTRHSRTENGALLSAELHVALPDLSDLVWRRDVAGDLDGWVGAAHRFRITRHSDRDDDVPDNL